MVADNRFILLVEDDNRLRSIITQNLKARGYLVLQAATVDEARERLSITPGLVILDLHLPDQNGWEVARWLHTHGLNVPVVVMSGYTRPSNRDWQEFHPTAFLPKPFRIDQLLNVVQEHTPAVRPA